MMYAETREKAVELKGKFSAWCEKHGWGSAAQVLAEDWERLVAYYVALQEQYRDRLIEPPKPPERADPSAA